jgi:hypothetical protein
VVCEVGGGAREEKLEGGFGGAGNCGGRGCCGGAVFWREAAAACGGGCGIDASPFYGINWAFGHAGFDIILRLIFADFITVQALYKHELGTRTWHSPTVY